jgi:alpha-1,6-mannosyltransferase
VKTIRARYGPSVRNWFLVLSMSQFHIPFYAGRTLPNFMILPGGTAGLILYPNRGQAESHVMLIHRSPPQLLLVATLLLKFRSTAGHSLAAASLHLLATNARLELAAFVIPLALTLVLLRKVNLAAAFSFGALGGFGVVRAYHHMFSFAASRYMAR